MSHRLSAEEAHLRRPEDGTLVAWCGSLLAVKQSGEATGGSHSVLEVLEPPGARSPVHMHSADETMYVLEGEYTVWCADLEAVAGPGTVVRFPRGLPHAHQVSGEVNARALLIFAPGGTEQFFVDTGMPTRRRELPRPTVPDPVRLAAAAKKYGLEFVDPALRRHSRRGRHSPTRSTPGGSPS
jgi:quercetin dioxygenase-like cupin family protein